MEDSILEEFAVEARELLEEAEVALLTLDSGGDPPAVYNSAFRTFHSLKGAAGMMGIIDVQNHMHLLESQFTKFEGKEDQIIKHLDYFLEGLDLASDLLEGKSVEFKTKAPFKEEKEGEGNVVSDKANSAILISTDEGVHQKVVEEFINSKSIFSLRDPVDAEKFVKINGIMPFLIDVKLKPGWLKSPISKKINAIYVELKDEQLIFNSEASTSDSLLSLAYREQRANELLAKSISLLMFQFSDLSEYLEKNDKNHILEPLREEIGEIIKSKKGLSAT